jgi:hypothetical protein
MEEQLFWRLLDDICDMGKFIAAVPNSGASANIVGRIQPGYDGDERVIEKKSCHCHVHLYPEQIVRFSFIYRDAGYGPEPCLELLDAKGDPTLRLYYHGSDPAEKFKRFTEKHADHSSLFDGSW